jgi:microcystin-dependent protein
LIYFCASTAPTGYLKANGALINRVTYASLFAAIGTTFGVGDNSTTFGLPDVRGQFVRAWTDGSGYDSTRVFGTLQSDAMQGHFHNFGQRNSVNGAGGGSYPWGVTEGGPNYATGSPITDGTNGTPRTAMETRPVNIALLACIRYI